MDYDDYEYKKSNREQAMEPSSGLYWCYNCDRNLVGPNEKCSVCGAKPIKKSLKKESSAR